MSWTYTNSPETVPRDAVRLAIGDTDDSDQQLSDEEIAYFLSLNENDVILASADAADALSAQYSRMAVEEVGDSEQDLSKKAQNYRLLADRLRARNEAGENGSEEENVPLVAAAGGIDRPPKFKLED